MSEDLVEAQAQVMYENQAANQSPAANFEFLTFYFFVFYFTTTLTNSNYLIISGLKNNFPVLYSFKK